ncbi:hypothetical protein E2562_009013 [Oryza meyeriana var. granulata]|uniref:Uncharacterized protein n=1 Tax=Oryza meyeriana var. granulata TaxID=110450 RepID=A0A6G1D0X2_9ORYZ|nr:hypothetical protein E2562_009013 [Oryza meyeriana var. granulata]
MVCLDNNGFHGGAIPELFTTHPRHRPPLEDGCCCQARTATGGKAATTTSAFWRRATAAA